MTRHTLSTAALILATFLCADATAIKKARPIKHIKHGTSELPDRLPIWGVVHVPPSYDGRPTPLLVALHGADSDGHWAIDQWRHHADERGIILLAPKSFDDSWDVASVFEGRRPVEHKAIQRAISHLKQRLSIDPQRVGIHGFSDGASTALHLALTDPLFKAVMANSAGGIADAEQYRSKLRPPVYLTHGLADDFLEPAMGPYLEEVLRERGHDVTYAGLEGQGHAFPNDQQAPMLDWFERQTAHRQ